MLYYLTQRRKDAEQAGKCKLKKFRNVKCKLKTTRYHFSFCILVSSFLCASASLRETYFLVPGYIVNCSMVSVVVAPPLRPM